MAFHSTYRPPPPAPSAFFALHLASSSSSAAPLASITDSAPSSSAASSSSSTTTATASTHGLPRIPSKLSVHVTCQSIALQAAQQQHIDLKAAALASGKSAPSRNNSASSITALPSLSSSLNNLMQATSIDHLDVCGTHPAEADELVCSRDSTLTRLPSPPPSMTSSRLVTITHIFLFFFASTAAKSDSRKRKATFKSVHGSSTYPRPNGQ
ncbi:hypothetical protein FRC16_009934 [Serendipita sp. 398]|nr:hypothetical protein FRC16_009934 [Serendipita sp. 398]